MSTRIAFLSEHASPAARLGGVDAGGQNVYVDEVSRALGRSGYTVDVFTRRERADQPEIMDWAPNVRIVNLQLGPLCYLPKDDLWPLMPGFRDRIQQFMARDGVRYDLIHSNFWMSGWVAAELRTRLGIPVVHIFHAMGKTKRRYQGGADTSPDDRIAVELQVVRSVDRMIAQCPSEHDELVNDYGADPARVAIIPSAVNTDSFRPVPQREARRRIGLDAETPMFVYVGRLLPRKDIRNVIHALAILSRRTDLPVHLLIVGGETVEPDPSATPELGVLQQLAADLGVGNRVTFVGKRQPDPDSGIPLRDYYSAADVAVTTPWYEPFGLTPLEGMACGRPVIGAAVGGISFTVKDGETGFLVPPRDPDALALRLHTLLADRPLARRMGQAARVRVEREFTWPVVAARTAALYEDVLVTSLDARHHALPQQLAHISRSAETIVPPGSAPTLIGAALADHPAPHPIPQSPVAGPTLRTSATSSPQNSELTTQN